MPGTVLIGSYSFVPKIMLLEMHISPPSLYVTQINWDLGLVLSRAIIMLFWQNDTKFDPDSINVYILGQMLFLYSRMKFN